MAILKRLDRLDVATSDLADAAATYQRNFGFAVTKSADGTTATVKVGGAEIRLASGPAVATQIDKAGEGMFALWLEAADIDTVLAAMRKAGVEPGAVRIDSGRRILAIDPAQANQVPLFIFDRKG